MNNKDINEGSIALLIDAENISPKYIKAILEELSREWTPAYRRIYGDFTSGDMSSWKKLLQEHGINPIQQFSYTQGKNATDSAMIIDAMDILYAANVDGFCIVSSDSDFTRLAGRLRESGMYVLGMGEQKTPVSFRAACNKFTILEALAREEKEQTAIRKTLPKKIVDEIIKIVDKDSEEDGTMMLSKLGIIVSRQFPDFDSRNYGYAKLYKLLESTGRFETTLVYDEKKKNKSIVLVKVKM